MKQIIYNAITKETSIVEVPDVVMPEIVTIPEPTLEERVSATEITQGKVIDVIAVSLGVTI